MTVAEAEAPTRARILDPAAIERKLALNTYNVDASRAHIRIIDHDVCLHCVRQQCINCCPANCYVPADDGRVIFPMRAASSAAPAASSATSSATSSGPTRGAGLVFSTGMGETARRLDGYGQ